MNARSLVVFVFLAVVAVIAIPISHVNAQAPTAPVISFSADLKTVSISYSGHAYTIPRPVAPTATFAPALGGRYWWVATTGNDSNVGTEAAPLRTIAKGITLAQAGDVIYVKAGTYEEGGMMIANKSGTVDRPFVLSAAPGDVGKVMLRHPGPVPELSNVVEFNITGGGYWTINGFVIEGIMPRNSTYTDESSGIMYAGGHGRILNNVVYANAHSGIKFGNYVDAVGNIVFANGYDSRNHGIYANGAYDTIDGNIIFDNTGYGIHSYADTAQHQTITRNVAFKNMWAGIIVAGSFDTVYNNTSAYNDVSQYGRGLFYFSDDSHDHTVKNNLFVFNTTDSDVDHYPYNLFDDYNDYYPGSPNARIDHIGTHELHTDPLFVNPASGDFRLQSNSPAIDRGVNVGLAYNGSAPDLGAFEWTSVSATATPTATATRTRTPTPGATPVVRLFLPISIR